jgi:hypothetical protein
MATMWPKEIPPWIAADSRRSAEIEVYKKLRDELDVGWSAYYSRPWWGISRSGAEVDGEADFIVANPTIGLLFLEVKGGRVEYSPDKMAWTSVDRHDVRRNIKNPVDQAVGAKRRYLEKLKNLPDWPGKFIRLRHGVIFPDSDERKAGSPFIGGIEKRIFCLATEFRTHFAGWIAQRMATHETSKGSPEAAPGAKVIELLELIVAAPADLHVPVGRMINPVIEQQENLLTGQQMAIAMLDDVQRALIVGGAGTGKTLVASEMAYRFARKGLRVALVCVAEPLAKWLEFRFKDMTLVSALTFHEFCQQIVAASGRGFSGSRSALPDVAARLLAEQPSLPWDVVIVDEGQDFLPAWWDVIERAVNLRKALLRVFYDSNQAVYARKDDLETRLGMQAFPLYNNLRNTQEIGRTAEQLYEGPKIECCGPAGGPIVCEPALGADALAAVAMRARDLVRDLVEPSDIAILVPSEAEIAPLGRALADLKVQWGRVDTRMTGLVTVETVARFKGLESPVVLLLANAAAANSRETAYVAVTRARVRLEIFGRLDGTALGDAVAKSSGFDGA